MSNCSCNSQNDRRFEAVWQRVLPDLDPPPAGLNDQRAQPASAMDSDEAFLRYCIDLECADVGVCEALACRCAGTRTGRVCACLAAENRDAVRSCQTAYLILTGERYTTRLIRPCISSPLEALRDQCLVESENSRMYQEYAVTTQNAQIARLCSCLAEKSSQNACSLERLINQAYL